MWGLALRVGYPIRVSSVGRLRGALTTPRAQSDQS